MCALCSEIAKGRITRRESITAAKELLRTSVNQDNEKEQTHIAGILTDLLDQEYIDFSMNRGPYEGL